MNKTFQIVLLIVFGLFVIIAVIVFALGSSSGTDVAQIGGVVNVWGPFPQRPMELLFGEMRDQYEQFEVNYTEHDPRTLKGDLVEALASGRGPDLVILPHTELAGQIDRLIPVSYEFIGERVYDDTFADAASIYKTSAGIYAFPFAADPLVMFWNKTIFANSGVAIPPKHWNEFLTLAPTITKKSGNNFSQSLVALGDGGNVLYTKEILSALTMQTGNPIVRYNDGMAEVVLDEGDGASSALQFFIEFANPNKTAYSWNSAQPPSREAFAGGNVAIYFGRASYIGLIRELNPHLDFDITILPQIKDSQLRVTYTDVYGVSITRGAPNPEGAYAVASLLTFGPFANRLPELLSLPPLRRDVLSLKPTDTIMPVLFESTIIARIWPDPNPEATNEIFKNMVSQVTVGRLTAEDAISRAQSLLANLIKPI